MVFKERRLALIGLVKNAGKTVALNHLVQRAKVPLGLCSAGRDGEAKDGVTNLPKPAIRLPVGTLFATAHSLLPAGAELLETTDLVTPLGPLVIARQMRGEGAATLITPGSRDRLGRLLERLEAHGAEQVLIDGAFDRLAFATLADGVILAVGAAYSPDMQITLAQLRHLLDLFNLPQTELPPCDYPVGWWQGGGWQRLPYETALQPIAVSEGTLSVRGAVGDRLIRALAPRVELIVEDATRIRVDRDRWRRWRAAGGRAAVRRPLKLLALTTNPYAPVGPSYEAERFHREVTQLAADLPVYDLVAGLGPEDEVNPC